MEFSGAVEATKTLRARDKSIDARVSIARKLLDGTVPVMLPRRHLVVLEWIFDMLATDSAASKSTALWQLLEKMWKQADDTSRMRIYRNHRFVTNLATALPIANSSQLILAIAGALKSISSTMDIASFATDAQASQLVLANLKSGAAEVTDEIGRITFDAVKSRTNLFGSKTGQETLDLLLKEPSQARRLHYLRDYCSDEANSPIASSDLHIEDVIQAICEANVQIQSRFNDLSRAYPRHSGRLLEVLVSLRPREASPELLDKLVSGSLESDNGNPDWTVMEICLHIDAAPVLKHMKRLLDGSPTDHVLALLITRSAALRSLPEFLSIWSPPTQPSHIVVSSFTRAIESLPPMRIAPLLKPDSKILELILKSLTYKAAGSSQVRDALQNLIDSNIEPRLKLIVLELAPGLQISEQQHKTKDFMVALRISEMQASFPELRSFVKRVESDAEADDILLRFYPIIEHAVDASKQLPKLINKTSSHGRLQLSQMDGMYENPKVVDALIEKLLDMREFEALSLIPKQLFAWNQRHRIVDAALRSGDPSMGRLVSNLIDSANAPDPHDLTHMLKSFPPTDVKVFISVIKPVVRHREYVKQLLDQSVLCPWQVNCILALISDRQSETLAWVQSEYNNAELLLPVLEVLSLLPESQEVSETVERLAVQLSSDPPELLFELVCRRKYHWSITSALFVHSNCQYADAYAAYCKELPASDRDCLILAAVDEDQHGVMQCLAAARLVQGPKHANAITVSIARCYFGATEVTSDFAGLCTTILREQLNLITGFGLEIIVAIIAKLGREGRIWEELEVLLSNTLLFQRRQLRSRMHLVVSALTSLLEGVDSTDRAAAYVRLVENLCSPPRHYLGGGKEDLNSAVARDRRNISRNLGVLLQNFVSNALSSQRASHEYTELNTALRPAAYAMMDVLGGEGVRSVAAGVDSASRTYLRTVYDDYTHNARWTSD